MSKNKIWNITDRDLQGEKVKAIAEKLGIQYITARLLYNRGYRTVESAEGFLKLSSLHFRDPFLMKDMENACKRIEKALEDGERITVYGDYDVDGVTSVSVLCLYLKSRGGNLGYYIPNRAGEGYGVNKEAIDKLVSNGTTLIVTVDTGITAAAEAEYARSLGCDIIVTDHHECHGELPRAAVAVLNPKRPDCPYPFKELAGVGVAFKLITALEMSMRQRVYGSIEGTLEAVCSGYIDLVAIGTVADVMPLCDENRIIVKMGLDMMNRSPRVGVKAIIEASENGKNDRKKAVTASLIGYTVAPRINAAGRMGSAADAAELFLTEREARAKEIATMLCETNRQRQFEENKIIEEIRDRVDSDPSLATDPIIVLDSESWHHGVIGIVASRISERYCRPSILISFEGDVGKGSGRSVKGLNLVEALGDCSELLLKYGGHELAAGLSIERENLPEFKKKLNEYVREHLPKDGLVTDIDIDCELFRDEVNMKQAEELLLLEPCGIANPVPMFMMSALTVCSLIPLGTGRHTKLILRKDGESFPAVFFGVCPDELGLVCGDTVDIVFNLGINEFRGTRTEQLLVRDIRLTSETMEKREEEYARYRTAIEGKGIAHGDIPQREDFVSAFLHLKRSLQNGHGRVDIYSMLEGLSATPSQSGPTNYVRLRLSLDILAEGGVIKTEQAEESIIGGQMLDITVNNLEKKVNLERSCLYQTLMKTTKTARTDSSI